MKLQKAIKILTVIPERNPNLAGNEFEGAIKLGIEALMDYQKLKLTTFLPIGYKLPGETP